MNDKEERIKRRREIIQKQRENVTKKEVDNLASTTETSPSDHQDLKSEQQIADSLSQLRHRKANLISEVTYIRINVDRRECSRRIEHENSRNENLSQARAEDGKAHSDSDTKWGDVINQGADLKQVHDAMEHIRGNYDDILQRKDNLIEDFRCKLRQQDHLYLETLREYERIIDRTRELTTDQTLAIQKLCKDESKSIDEAFREDRRILIDEQSTQLKSLMEKKRCDVVTSLTSMQGRMGTKEQSLLTTHDKVTEEYNVLRNKLQEQVAELEREWSVSRGLYSVSTDQIEYDHREIETRNAENEHKIKKSKKRIIQFKEELNRELDRTRSAEEKERRKNGSLELDCRRLEGQYSNLLSKLHRFELLEDQKFSSALSMHKEEAKSLSNRITDVRGIITDNFFDQR